MKDQERENDFLQTTLNSVMKTSPEFNITNGIKANETIKLFFG